MFMTVLVFINQRNIFYYDVQWTLCKEISWRKLQIRRMRNCKLTEYENSVLLSVPSKGQWGCHRTENGCCPVCFGRCPLSKAETQPLLGFHQQSWSTCWHSFDHMLALWKEKFCSGVLTAKHQSCAIYKKINQLSWNCSYLPHFSMSQGVSWIVNLCLV